MQQRIDRNSLLDEGNIGWGGLCVNKKYAAKYVKDYCDKNLHLVVGIKH